jgi:hypothetical protein
MSVLADLLNSGDTFNTGPFRQAADRVTHQHLKNILTQYGDFDYPPGYDAVDEVQSVAAFVGEPEEGTFTLEFALKGGETFITTDIAYDADAETIQAAIDDAADGVVTGYSAGDIVVAGGPLTEEAITLTYSGASVAAKRHSLVQIEVTELTGGAAGDATTVVSGQTKRAAWAVLKALGIITSAPPTQGDDVVSVTVGTGRGELPYGLCNDDLRTLVEEAAYDDGNDTVRDHLLAALNL